MIICYSKNSALTNNTKFLHVKTFAALESALVEDEQALLIVDIAMLSDETTFFENIRKNFLHVKIFALSNKPTFVEGTRLLHYGINGYGNIHMNQVHLQDALHAIAKGDTWLYPEFVQSMIKSFNKFSEQQTEQIIDLSILSQRELEIANLVKQGFTNKEIANYSGITERTVKAHLSSIFEKLKIKDRLTLALKMR